MTFSAERGRTKERTKTQLDWRSRGQGFRGSGVQGVRGSGAQEVRRAVGQEAGGQEKCDYRHLRI